MKANILPPTMRDRNRYLAFQLESEKRLDRKNVVNAIWNSLLRLHGEAGAASANLWVMDWDTTKGVGVIKFSHNAKELIATALLFLSQVGGTPVRPKTITISGTLKKARSEAGLEKES